MEIYVLDIQPTLLNSKLFGKRLFVTYDKMYNLYKLIEIDENDEGQYFAVIEQTTSHSDADILFNSHPWKISYYY